MRATPTSSASSMSSRKTEWPGRLGMRTRRDPSTADRSRVAGLATESVADADRSTRPHSYARVDDELGRRVRARVLLRTVPYLLLLYFVAYLDRVNISYAALEMRHDLPLTDSQYGFGAGIFFFGYFLFEIPGTLLVETWSARKLIARILVGWGLVACAMAFVHTPRQFFWLRFLLGAAEAGFFPGVVVYLSHWFRVEDRARAFALLHAGGPDLERRRRAGLRAPARRPLGRPGRLALAVPARGAPGDRARRGDDLLPDRSPARRRAG